ncbi:MAG: CBS domain-containing protein [Syntrophobacteraceae bacterium]
MKNVRDVLREKGSAVYSIGPEETVYDALRLMAEKNVAALPVFEGDRLAGMISERDYARKIILHQKASKETKVREIMTAEVITVTQSVDLEQCMEIFTEKRIRHLPVVENDRVIGIISMGDVVKGIIGHKEDVIDQLEGYIKGHHGTRRQV